LITRNCTLLIIFFCNVSNAAIDWSWNFSPASISVDASEFVSISIEVTNSAASSSSIYADYFDFLDGSWDHPWGLILNNDGEVIYTPIAFASYSLIMPGQTISINNLFLTPSNLEGGEVVTIDPLFYVSGSLDGAGILPGQFSSTPLQLLVQPVPLPASFVLFFSALFFTTCITRLAKIVPLRSTGRS
jgi:hypothetical protein